jgi:hypothetical protein
VLLGVTTPVVLIVFLMLVGWPACACLPREFEPVAVGKVPPSVLAEALERSPGFRVEQAWIYGYGLRGSHPSRLGFQLRGRVPGSIWRAKLVIPQPPAAESAASPELAPIDGPAAVSP